MEAFVATAPARWGISPETSCGPPTGGKLPTGGSVLPKVGPTWIVAGDAAGSINPFNGEGIAYGYETGRMAADAVSEALRTGDGLALARYPERLEEIYGLYFKVARTFVTLIGNPAVMRELTRVGMHSRTLMEWVLRIMANLLRPDELGPAEAAYAAVEVLVRAMPDPSDRRARAVAETALERTAGRSDSPVMVAMDAYADGAAARRRSADHAEREPRWPRHDAPQHLPRARRAPRGRSRRARRPAPVVPPPRRRRADPRSRRGSTSISRPCAPSSRCRPPRTACCATRSPRVRSARSTRTRNTSRCARCEELRAYPSVVSTDGSAAQNAVQLPFRRPGRFTPFTARVGEHFERAGVRRRDDRGRAVGVVRPRDPRALRHRARPPPRHPVRHHPARPAAAGRGRPGRAARDHVHGHVAATQGWDRAAARRSARRLRGPVRAQPGDARAGRADRRRARLLRHPARRPAPRRDARPLGRVRAPERDRQVAVLRARGDVRRAAGGVDRRRRHPGDGRRRRDRATSSRPTTTSRSPTRSRRCSPTTRARARWVARRARAPTSASTRARRPPISSG